MAKVPRLSAAAVAAGIQAIGDLLNGGKLRIYDGSAPAHAGVAISGQVLLAEVALDTPAVASVAAAGHTAVATLAVVTPSPLDEILATSTATFFRALTAGNSTVAQGTVGTANADMIVPSTAFIAGRTVEMTSAKIALPQYEGAPTS
jgi:hypothetical protein